MPIIRNTELNKYTDALETRYNKLISQIKGEKPNENIYHLYEDDPIVFEREYRTIDDLEITLAINDFNGILKELKKIKNKIAQADHNR